MPPDTIPIQDTHRPPTPVDNWAVDSFEVNQMELRKAYQQHLDSLGDKYLYESREENKRDPGGEAFMFFLILVVLASSAFFYIIKPDISQRKKKKLKYGLDRENKPGTEMRFHQWLNKYNPYYASLNPELKSRFIERASQFMLRKEFKFHSMVEEEYIPVLVSGAAVQMTFGLKNYMMDYFPSIHVIRKEYVLHVDKETYYGHVSRSGIYVSWSSFLEGYNDYEDSVNVGLHEMAHAVSYDLFLGEQDWHDSLFRQRLREFTHEGSKVFRSMQSGEKHLFDSYGRTNFDEFWAVCVETFFEKAAEFEKQYPVLYQQLCKLLNQDPLSAGKIIDPELAGV